LTEQLGGVRALWNGKVFMLKKTPLKEKLYRYVRLVPPKWFKEQLPNNISLDGELWCDMAEQNWVDNVFTFQTITNDIWQTIQFVICDSPDPKIRERPYLHRLQLIKQSISHTNHAASTNYQRKTFALSPNVQLVDGEVCQSYNHLTAYFKDIMERGGKGVLLRHHSLPYDHSYEMYKKEVCST
jgi:DNA ligase-1